MSNAKRRHRRQRRARWFWARVEHRRQQLAGQGYRRMAVVGCLEVWTRARMQPGGFTLQVETSESR